MKSLMSLTFALLLSKSGLSDTLDSQSSFFFFMMVKLRFLINSFLIHTPFNLRKKCTISTKEHTKNAHNIRQKAIKVNN